jgi:hypothetical protein
MEPIEPPYRTTTVVGLAFVLFSILLPASTRTTDPEGCTAPELLGPVGTAGQGAGMPIAQAATGTVSTLLTGSAAPIPPPAVAGFY